MRRRAALLLSFVAFLGLAAGAAAADGKLPTAEWKQIEADAEAALEKKSVDPLREVLDRAVKDQSVRCLKLLEKIASLPDSDWALSSCTRSAQALDGKDVRKELRKDATGTKNPKVRAALCPALRAKDAEDVPVLIKLVADPSEDVAIPAIRALADAKVEAAVEPLIAAMEKQDTARGSVWEELHLSLSDLLGRKLGSGGEFRVRWNALKPKGGMKAIDGPDDPKPADAAPEPTGKPGAPHSVELFGREVACTRVVFILDVSGSMTEVDDPELALPAETKARTPAKDEADPRSRIERVKREFKKVLKAMPKTTKVNLITFSTSVRLWKGGNPPVLHALDDATREEAMKYVDTFRAEGTTVTDEALARAFEIEGARCFYLLSDGEPTKDGTTRIPTEVILKLIEEKNATRKVRIHTLGFKGADQDFMKTVAKATGGEYSDIK
jgi:Mg-chelatase subunit ChlD